MRMQPNENETGFEEKRTEPLNEEQRDLAARYVPLGMAIAREFTAGWGWIQDEMESAAMMALVDAARCFDPAFNVKFATYARRRISGYLCDTKRKYLQSHYRRNADSGSDVDWFSVKNVSNMSSSEMLNLGEKIAINPDRNRFGPDFEVHDTLENCFQRLPIRHREVMRSLYFDKERSFEEIASQYKVTPDRLVILHRQSLNMLLSEDSVPTAKSRRRGTRKSRPTDPGFPVRTAPNLG